MEWEGWGGGMEWEGWGRRWSESGKGGVVG